VTGPSDARQRRGAQTKKRNHADQRPERDTEVWWTRLGRDSPRTARRLAACAVVAWSAALASAAAAPAQDSPLHLTEVVDDMFTDIQYRFAPRRPIFVAGVRIFDGQALCAALAG
jgi:hypothetical protein